MDEGGGMTVHVHFDLTDPDEEHRMHRCLAADELCSFVWDVREAVLRPWRKGEMKPEIALDAIQEMTNELDHIMAHYV
jgi:hypothetical protein